METRVARDRSDVDHAVAVVPRRCVPECVADRRVGPAGLSVWDVVVAGPAGEVVPVHTLPRDEVEVVGVVTPEAVAERVVVESLLEEVDAVRVTDTHTGPRPPPLSGATSLGSTSFDSDDRPGLTPGP